MRQPAEWIEDDLLGLIKDQVAESLTLDYKASASLQRTDGKKADLSKDVSAFANSAGGLLVYGIKENGHIPTELDEGLNPDEISKEWLEQVINSRISRRIDGIQIQQIYLTGTRTGRVAYIVAVPASARAPHMASDHRFYKRFNFESVPMEEYEVRDVSRRLVAPDVRFGAALLNEVRADATPIVAQLDSYVENLSPSSASFALITFHLTARNFPTVGGMEKVGETMIVLSEGLLPVHSFKLEWRGSARLPLMQGARYHVAQLGLSVADVVGPAQIFWEVLAPGAEPNRGSYLVLRQNDFLSIAPTSDEWKLSQAIHWHI
jgi:hypothetical protein